MRLSLSLLLVAIEQRTNFLSHPAPDPFRQTLRVFPPPNLAALDAHTHTSEWNHTNRCPSPVVVVAAAAAASAAACWWWTTKLENNCLIRTLPHNIDH